MKEQSALPSEAETLLADWPTGKSEQDWEELATRIEARAERERGAVDDALFEPPALADEGPPAVADAVPTVPEQEQRSAPGGLTDLARSVAGRDSDDSVRRIAAESLSLAGHEPLASPEPERRVPVVSQIELKSPERAPRAAAPAPAAAVSNVVDVREARDARGGRNRTGVFAGAALAAVAVAAAVVLFLPGESKQAPAVALTPAKDIAPAPPAVAHGEISKAARPDVVELEDLPTGERPPSAPTEPGPIALAPRAPASPLAKPGAPAEPALEGAPRAAPPAPEPDPDDATMEPAAQEPTRLEPGRGEAQAAVGAFLGGARACVAAHDAPSRAVVTFGPDGRVQSVTVEGPAAGTPAEGCIRAALKGAKVGKFAKASYSAAAAIRPP